MSSRGRKPKPTELKRLQGNPGKRAMNGREPKPKTPVKRPRGLKGIRRKFWDEHAEELERLCILTGVDVPAFRLLLESYSFAIEAAADLRHSSFTVEGRDGPKKNPLVQVWRDNALLFKSMATEFGMTPSSRARLKLPEEAEQLSLADQLFRAVQDSDDGD